MRLIYIFPIVKNRIMSFYLVRKYNSYFDSFSFRFTKDRTLHSPFPTFSQIHVIASRFVLDANIKSLPEYKRSGAHIAPVLFFQLISQIQGLAEVIKETKAVALMNKKVKSPGWR